MAIKKVTLKNIKRSYRRIEDNTHGPDLGWWCAERRDAMEILRETGSIREVLEYGKGLLAWMDDDREAFPEGMYEKVEAWVKRWTAACDACGV